MATIKGTAIQYGIATAASTGISGEAAVTSLSGGHRAETKRIKGNNGNTMSFVISQTSLTARSSSAFTSSVRVNKTRTTSSSSRHSSSSSSSIVTKCEGPSAKNLEIMRKFSEQYARSSGTKFCMDKSVTAVVIQGTFNHTTIATFSSFFICGPMHFSSRLRSLLNNNNNERKQQFCFFGW